MLIDCLLFFELLLSFISFSSLVLLSCFDVIVVDLFYFVFGLEVRVVAAQGETLVLRSCLSIPFLLFLVLINRELMIEAFYA